MRIRIDRAKNDLRNVLAFVVDKTQSEERALENVNDGAKKKRTASRQQEIGCHAKEQTESGRKPASR